MPETNKRLKCVGPDDYRILLPAPSDIRTLLSLSILEVSLINGRRLDFSLKKTIQCLLSSLVKNKPTSSFNSFHTSTCFYVVLFVGVEKYQYDDCRN